MLTDRQLERYSRQLLLNEFDIAGQERLLAAKVLVLGLGGLGSPAALYLAAAGVGNLILADGDEVELSNLQRQIAHSEADIGINKAVSAAATITSLNSDVEVEVIAQRLAERQMAELVHRVDLVIDATDNYPARFALNRLCIAAATPLVSAAAVKTEGQLSLFDPIRGGPCYRCIYPDTSEMTALSCSESGVLAPVVGALGALQALEAIKYLTDYGESARSRLLLFDLRSLQTRELRTTYRDNCPDCMSLRCR
ncbi:MAG: HesA/MoeB/ThiF family protein [Pseudomonadota bacterium]